MLKIIRNKIRYDCEGLEMRIIDLLNKIANGEEVPLIKIYGRTLRYNKKEHWFDDIDDESYCRYQFTFEELNDEVEVIE